MAVDIKTLRIGSHVEYDGKRVCVDEIKTSRMEGLPIRLLVSHNGLIYGDPSIGETEPIPITPDLLKELGFMNTSSTRRIVYTKGSEYEDSWIEFRNLKDRWEIFVSKDNWDGRTAVRYLHEAEAFLALHGVELIKE